MIVQSSHLEQAIAAVRAGRKTEARTLLQKVLAVDRNNEDAWLWMSAVVDSDAQRAECLRRVLRINPHNAAARKGLARLEAKRQAETAPPAAPRSCF